MQSDEPIIDTAAIDVDGFTFFVSSVIPELDDTWTMFFYTMASSDDRDAGMIGRATALAPTGPWTVDSEPVLKPGETNAWDGHRVTHPSVIRVEEGYLMYYAGFAEENSNSLRQIGLATSSDGIRWRKTPEPILTIGDEGAWDGQRIFQPHVVRTDEGWLMLYKANQGFLFRQGWGFAHSRDGIHWVKDAGNPLINADNLASFSYNWFADLLWHDGVLHLYLEVLGSRTSDIHLLTFSGTPKMPASLRDSPVSVPPITPSPPFTYENMGQVLPVGEAGAWDGGAIYIPEVHHIDGKFHLFYSGFADRNYSDGAIGYATSEDGVHWTKYAGNPILNGDDNNPRLQSAAVMYDGERWTMFVDATTKNSVASSRIYRATAPAPAGPWTLEPEPILESGGFGVWDRLNNPSAAISTSEGVNLYYFAWGSSTVQLGLATALHGQPFAFYNDPETGSPYDHSDPVLLSGAPNAWDSKGVSANQIQKTEDGWELFYTGFSVYPINSYNSAPHHIGYATSQDGVHWVKHPANPIIPLSDERIWPAVGFVVNAGTYYIYYDRNGGLDGIGLIMAKVNE